MLYSRLNDAGTVCGLAIQADAQGTVRILYRSATENVHRDIYLLTSEDHARSFAARKLHEWNINACPMSSMAFTEADGRVEGAWESRPCACFHPKSSK